MFHVIARGIERRDIFVDDDDRHLFVQRLSSLLESTSTFCLAWSLIPNHFHLLIRTSDVKLTSSGLTLQDILMKMNHDVWAANEPPT
jgi:REP element-mobilizing transposase RayT